MSDLFPRNESEVVAAVKRLLGAPTVNIELDDTQLSEAFRASARWYIARKGFKRRLYLPFTPKIDEYVLPADVEIVIEVVPPQIIPEYPGYYLEPNILIMEDIERGMYSSLVQEMQYEEMAKRILSQDFWWEMDQETKKLVVHTKDQVSGSMQVIYISRELNLDKVEAIEVDLVVRRTLAEAKEMLGRVRGKYQEWPMAGGPKQLDGDKLLDEAKAEKEALDTEIAGYSYPGGIVVR